ncbi:S9 family peptidase [Shewanella waksmanii]|uniref:S9 family peptidase n=1 Tax=Shewanella waksmanii TaxID=213783 RepID=UPI003736B9A4
MNRFDTTVCPPVAEKRPVTHQLHGINRLDNYHWLRDDKRQEPQMLSHLQAEKDYCDAVLAPVKPLYEKLLTELTSRVDKDESSVPYVWHQHWYQHRYSADNEYPVFERSAEREGDYQVMLDLNQRAQDHEFYDLGGLAVSPDENLLAFAEDTLSRRIYTVFIKDLRSGQLLSDTLTGIDGQIVWAQDNQHLFYIAKDPQTLLGNKVYCHRIGTAQVDDRLVYQERDDSFYLSLGKTLDETLITLCHESTITSEVSVLAADNPSEDFKALIARETGIEYSLAKHGQRYFILTNWQAENFQLMSADADVISDRSQWQVVKAGHQTCRIEDVLALENHLIVQTREQGLTHIYVYDMQMNLQFELPFKDGAYVTGLDVNPQQNSDKLRVYYSSLTTPESVFEYDLNTAEAKLLKQQKVNGNFQSQDYQSERIFVSARDGQRIPVSLVYRRDKFAKDGTNPLYQYGYGAYGHTIEPWFDSAILSLLDRGIVYAIAHIRGGEMLGRHWYDSGRMFNKKNTFNDFIDVSHGLIEQQYCHQDKIVASGGSAGGLLIGCVINQAPQLYCAVAAHVPFVDIVSTMLDETLPLTTNEYDEWGNPNELACFEYMLSYSPYDQVTEQAYPPMLVTSGLHDSQVQYFEPAKWVAKLREYSSSDQPILFDIDLSAGHGGKSGRFKHYQDVATEYSFLLTALAVPE